MSFVTKLRGKGEVFWDGAGADLVGRVLAVGGAVALENFGRHWQCTSP